MVVHRGVVVQSVVVLAQRACAIDHTHARYVISREREGRKGGGERERGEVSF